MGVNSLWDIVGPAARPVKLEALSRKKLAVDASIWIYQFLKAVRDKDGNSFTQSHIVGFFRRICKLLYFGILPLFVFDGGAPPLKRQVIQQRRERRQGNSENASITAQKLLAIQVQRQAQNLVKPEARAKALEDGERTYLEDLPLLHPEHGTPRQPHLVLSNETSPNKRFVKKDEFHLPELKQFTVSRYDKRIMPESEFPEYGEDASLDTVDGIDIDSVDPESAEFAELPMATQYMILSHLRLRSRLRMGYSKDQLEGLFPNSKDFSRFQIEQVQKRNFYTQKLMTVSGMSEDSGNITRRIASDKDRNYSLVKNDDGWTLSLGGDQGDGEPIELDERGEIVPKILLTLPENLEENENDDSDMSLEDVSLEEGEAQEDDDINRAIIESIYDSYKDDYKEKVEEEFDQIEFQNAVEETKKEFLEQKGKEEEFQEKFTQALESGNSGFDFGQSILFGNSLPLKPSDAVESAVASVNVDISRKRAMADHTGAGGENAITLEIEALTKEDNEAGNFEMPAIVLTMPSWFDGDNSQINNPHSSTTFLRDRPQKDRKLNEEEEAGLISWTEAQELMRDSVSGSSGDDPGVCVQDNLEFGGSEEVKELENSEIDSDVEITETREIVKPAASAQADSEGFKYSIDAETEKPENGVLEAVEILIPETLPEIKTQEKKLTKKSEILDYYFEENDEKELVKQLQDEEEQHVEFTTQFRAKHQLPTLYSSITDEQLLREKLQKAKRDAEEVSQTMVNDVQELLKRFGIPYITAPMEAEAQCAELFQLGLVDGIVTDDSDCFLFGGSRIYKNMFNQKQYVECYIAEDIENKVGLNQKKLIELALLLGSDYTEGIKGIGPVLAMEILAEFGTLGKFKEWYDLRTQTSYNEKSTALQKSLLTRIKNGKLFLPENFPDGIVVNAYTHAEVDHDSSEFQWGVPSLDQIRTFLMYNVGWNQSKVDEVMVPLVRDMNRKRSEGTQSTIGEFFPQDYISYKKDVALGKRMKVAANKLNKRK